MKIYSWYISGIATLVATSGFVVMLGWFFDIDFLKRVIPGFVTMKFTTALSFLLAGIALFSAQRILSVKKGVSEVVLPIVTLLLLLTTGVILSSIVLNINSGLENLFVQESVEAIYTVEAGQPSLGTLISFIIIGIMALIALSREVLLVQRSCLVGGVGIILLSGGALFGYVIDIPVLFYFVEGVSTAMAIHTAALLFSLAVGFILLGKRNFSAVTHEI